MLSGNRNFEGRVNPDVRANYLASPPLVVAYALAGSMNVDLATDPIGHDRAGKAVYLRDIWPSSTDVAEFVRNNVTSKAFQARYKDVFKGDADIELIRNSVNIGHGPAIRQALQRIQSPYVVTLDSDACPLSDDWLQRLSAC